MVQINQCLTHDGVNVDKCLVPLETTRCSSVHSMSFYFDSDTGQCAELSHDCSSSDNAFVSLESCQMECTEHHASFVPDTTARGLKSLHIYIYF